MSSVATIGRRKRWAPPVHARVNRKHPLAQGLVRAYIPMAGMKLTHIDLVVGDRVSDLRSCTMRPCETGLAYDRSANAGGTETWASTIPLPVMADISYLTLWCPRNLGNPFLETLPASMNVSSLIAGSVTQPSMFMAARSTVLVMLQHGPGQLVGRQCSNTWTLDRFYWVGASRVGTAQSGINLYINGQQQSASNVSFAGSYSALSSGTGLVWQPQASAASTSDKAIGPHFIWNRALTAADYASLYADPFQMLVW